MPKQSAPSRPGLVPLPPVPETLKVLTVLAPLDHPERLQVLSAAIAFFGIGNLELNAVK